MSPEAHVDTLPAVGVVEFDPVGHRLAFVGALLREAAQTGVALRVVTTPRARDSAEWREHIGDVDSPTVVQLEHVPRGTWQYAD